MRVAIVVMLALTGCANVHVNRATLVGSTASLALDWWKTRGYAADSWPGRSEETNPLMGRAPSTGRVDLYFASFVAVNAVVWYLMPERWRSVVPTGILAVQAQAAYRNIRNDTW